MASGRTLDYKQTRAICCTCKAGALSRRYIDEEGVEIATCCLLLREVAIEGVAQRIVQGGWGDVAAVRTLQADEGVKLLELDAIQELPGCTCGHPTI